MGCRSVPWADWTDIIGVVVGRGAVLRVQSSLEWLVCVRAAGLTVIVPVSRVEGFN